MFGLRCKANIYQRGAGGAKISATLPHHDRHGDTRTEKAVQTPYETLGGEDVAKDGTNRGGWRVRVGDKLDALSDKIADGREAAVMEFPMTELNGAELTNVADLYGEEMPQPNEYLSAKQRDGRPLGADEIFRETWIWLKEWGCEKLVNPRLIESYA